MKFNPELLLLTKYICFCYLKNDFPYLPKNQNLKQTILRTSSEVHRGKFNNKYTCDSVIHSP